MQHGQRQGAVSSRFDRQPLVGFGGRMGAKRIDDHQFSPLASGPRHFRPGHQRDGIDQMAELGPPQHRIIAALKIQFGIQGSVGNQPGRMRCGTAVIRPVPVHVVGAEGPGKGTAQPVTGNVKM